MVRLRAIPLLAELKDLDLRPYPTTWWAMRHAARRVKSTAEIVIWLAHRKTGSNWPNRNQYKTHYNTSAIVEKYFNDFNWKGEDMRSVWLRPREPPSLPLGEYPRPKGPHERRAR